jgi:hypothetical protein
MDDCRDRNPQAAPAPSTGVGGSWCCLCDILMTYKVGSARTACTLRGGARGGLEMSEVYRGRETPLTIRHQQLHLHFHSLILIPVLQSTLTQLSSLHFTSLHFTTSSKPPSRFYISPTSNQSKCLSQTLPSLPKLPLSSAAAATMAPPKTRKTRIPSPWPRH